MAVPRPVTTRPVTLAEKYRAHRAEMELVIATGCTVLEARAELRRVRTARRDSCGRAVPDPAPAAPDFSHDYTPDRGLGTRSGEWNAPWMMRD